MEAKKEVPLVDPKIYAEIYAVQIFTDYGIKTGLLEEMVWSALLYRHLDNKSSIFDAMNFGMRQWRKDKRGRNKKMDALKYWLEKRIKVTKKFKEEYGWLSPEGKFYPSWSSHESWANEYVQEYYVEEFRIWAKSKVFNIGSGDFLISKGWVLLHDPANRGVFYYIELRDLTKKQKEFLYDYCIKHDLKREAESIVGLL